jgi:hypothetical protein
MGVDEPLENFPIHPKHPERICWGCNKFCPADDLACGNGSIRSPHPVELFGDDWFEWSQQHEAERQAAEIQAASKSME